MQLSHLTVYAPRLFALSGPRWSGVRLPSPLALAAGAVVAAVLLPLVYLVLRALGAGSDGLAYLLHPRTLAVLVNSAALTAAVALAAAVIGALFAWLTARTDLPLRRLWLVAGLLPLVIPSYVGAITLIAVLGPRGLVQQALAPLGVTELPSIYGFWGAWLSLTLFTFPYVALPVRAALLKMDPALEECGHSMGLGRRAVFWRVTLPQLRPALAAGMLLAALYTLSDFGAVALMRFDAFTRVIYIQYTSSFDRSRAAVLALVLVAITLALVLLERRASALTRNYRAGTGAQRLPHRVALGRWKAPALAFCAALVGLGLALPVAVLAMWALQAGAPGAELSLALVNTVSASGLTAGAVGLAALPVALLAVRSPSRLGRAFSGLPYIGNVLPGLVVALALVFFAANYFPALYQTLPVLVLGYATRFLPLSIGATRSALTQINPRLEEAGRSLGCRPWAVTARVTAPLARGGILAGMALVFLSAMKELPTTLLLAPTGYRTLATDIWAASAEARLAQVGLPGLVLVAASALGLFIVLRQSDR
ncbi:MAG: ABC transporter permease [Aggregatilineales bacterium]